MKKILIILIILICTNLLYWPLSAFMFKEDIVEATIIGIFVTSLFLMIGLIIGKFISWEKRK